MDKNQPKSIDGLKSRSQKLSRAKKIPVKKTTPSPKQHTATQPPRTEIIEETQVIDIATTTNNKSSAETFLETTKHFDFDDIQTEELIQSEDEKAEDETLMINSKELQKEKKHRRKPRKKPSKARKIITTIILAIVLLLISAVVFLLVWGNDIITKLTGGNSNIWETIGTLVTEKYDPLKSDTNGRTNILVFGTSGYDMYGTTGDGQTHDGAQLTDSIMIVSLNQENGDVALMSIPRDLKVSDRCTATGKINEVYWCHNQQNNNETAGAEALMQEVGNDLGIDFQYFVHVNWESLSDIVDLLGGITVTVDEDIYDPGYSGANIKANTPTRITGGEAVALARARHGTSMGDFSRGNSQQRILIGIKDELMQANLDFDDIIKLTETLGDNLRTNLSISEIKTSVHLLSEFDFDNMRQISLLDWDKGINYMTTATINGISYVIPSAGAGNYSAIQSYVNKMFNSTPATLEEANILVLNGTETPGLAATESEKLEQKGFTVGDSNNAPSSDYTENYLYNLTNTKPETIKALEEYYNITSLTSAELPEGINTAEYDIVLIVGQP